MSKKANFSPHLYADWGELFKVLTDKQKADVLMAITVYPDYEPENNPVWPFIKLQIDKIINTAKPIAKPLIIF